MSHVNITVAITVAWREDVVDNTIPIREMGTLQKSQSV